MGAGLVGWYLKNVLIDELFPVSKHWLPLSGAALQSQQGSDVKASETRG